LFSLGGACYPENHIECRDLEQDLDHLKLKVEGGLDFVITQLFFDNADYFSCVERARVHSIRVRIIPAMMPIISSAQIERSASTCDAKIPHSLNAKLEAVRRDTDTARSSGIDHATTQCHELRDREAPAIHLYTLNQSPATRVIFERLRE
jgi:methylenetetrahydrofolate reductase (NADPH)